jgi:3-phytase
MAAVLLGVSGIPTAEAQPVQAVLSTQPLYNYEDAPGTPDADDPAIWVNRRNPRRSLVIGTAKDAGLLVYDLSGTLVQAIRPVYAPRVLPEDPPTPAGVNPAPDRPCPDSTSGETFGRFNNVDIAYAVRLGRHPHSPSADVAVVSDRGCDRVRFFAIDPSRAGGPLFDITALDVPRVFPRRYEQPSPLQPSGAVEGWRDNPVDDQNTVYGLTVDQGSGEHVFVSQRERGLVSELRIVPTGEGTLTYEIERTFLFRTSFGLRDEQGAAYRWTPCREAALEEPQSEGLVFDHVNETLYVAFETIGLYKLPLRGPSPEFREIGGDQLIEPLTSFGQRYRAIPDDDEFECEYGSEPAEPGDVVAPGSDVNAGRFLAADLEGLSIIASDLGNTLLLASSQGDSSFHLYEIDRRRHVHLGSFLIDGVGDTDGVHYVPVRILPAYPLGLLVVQNGEAPEPADTGDINGFEFDGATQFKYVSFLDALRALF